MTRLATFYFIYFVILNLAAEFAIRKSEKFAVHAEKNGMYSNPLNVTEELNEPWLLVYPKDIRAVFRKPEFEAVIVSNSEGLVGHLPAVSKERNEYRIVAIGDSSTEGAGDEEELGFVGRLARKYSKTRGKVKYTFINAGISGSDPVFELELLKRKLLKYQPDLVLFLMNTTDINDVKRRGGLDRFTNEGRLKDRMPFWTPIFNASHLVRAFVLYVLDYSWQLKPRSLDHQDLGYAINGIVDTFKAANQLAIEKRFKTLVLLEPSAAEVVKGKFPPFYKEIEKGLVENNIDVANLLPFFLEKISERDSKEYFWPIDEHFNSKGYEVFFEAIEFELKKRKLIE